VRAAPDNFWMRETTIKGSFAEFFAPGGLFRLAPDAGA
jgi:hypothetical protein